MRKITILMASILAMVGCANDADFNKPALNKPAPTISVNQCTPETKRPITIYIEKPIPKLYIILFKTILRTLRCICSNNVGITLNTRSVVEDG